MRRLAAACCSDCLSRTAASPWQFLGLSWWLGPFLLCGPRRIATGTVLLLGCLGVLLANVMKAARSGGKPAPG